MNLEGLSKDEQYLNLGELQYYDNRIGAFSIENSIKYTIRKFPRFEFIENKDELFEEFEKCFKRCKNSFRALWESGDERGTNIVREYANKDIDLLPDAHEVLKVVLAKRIIKGDTP